MDVHSTRDPPAGDALATISASKITTYLMCPRKYAFRYVEGATPAWKSSALAFGSAVHSALELFHQRIVAGQKPDADEAVSTFLTDWAAEEAGELRLKEDESPEGLRALGEQLVRLYVEEHADLRVVAAEWPFQVPLHDMATGETIGPDLKGVFDLLLWDDTLVEIKTAARAYSADQLRTNQQFSAYAYAYRRVTGRDPKLRVVALIKTKKPRIDRYEVSRPVEHDGRFVRVASAVARAIEVGAFPPNPGWMCADCEYGPVCEAWAEPGLPVVTDERRHLPVLAAGAVP